MYKGIVVTMHGNTNISVQCVVVALYGNSIIQSGCYYDSSISPYFASLSWLSKLLVNSMLFRERFTVSFRGRVGIGLCSVLGVYSPEDV